jgi:hypothetical protein
LRNNLVPGRNAAEINSGALVRSNGTEVSHGENQKLIDKEATFSHPMTKPAAKLIGDFEPKEESVWGEKDSLGSVSQKEQKDFQGITVLSTKNIVYDTTASALAGVHLLGKALRKTVAKAISRATSLMHFGSRVVFSAVSGPAVFVGLRLLGVSTLKSFTTAGAFAASPFVVSSVRMANGSVSFAKYLGSSGYRVFQGTRRLFSTAMLNRS